MKFVRVFFCSSVGLGLECGGSVGVAVGKSFKSGKTIYCSIKGRWAKGVFDILRVVPVSPKENRQKGTSPRCVTYLQQLSYGRLILKGIHRHLFYLLKLLALNIIKLYVIALVEQGCSNQRRLGGKKSEEAE
jgi:hypothetical protein